VVHAGVGEAGALIPPFEYHLLENAGEAIQGATAELARAAQ